jgi:very-short-patch-repair endonuclease
MPNAQARSMRRVPTEPERLLWSRLRDRRLGRFKFRRQRPIGQFIADFACMERRLIVEADGGQHADSEYDAFRTDWLQRQGWRMTRFWNHEVLENPNGVAHAILLLLQHGES